MENAVPAAGEEADYLKRVSLSLRKQLSRPVVKVSSNPIYDAGDDVSQV
jgi:hypothetical protein